jgi:hypothetical protein
MDGEVHCLATAEDEDGEVSISYRASLDGVPRGYAESDRIPGVRRWEARLGREEIQEETTLKKEIPYADRTYLFVPYEEREEAKVIGA